VTVSLLLAAALAGVRRLSRQNEIWIVRASGLMFIGFAVNAVMHAVPGLVARRA
jgi:threonine efflux protein